MAYFLITSLSSFIWIQICILVIAKHSFLRIENCFAQRIVFFFNNSGRSSIRLALMIRFLLSDDWVFVKTIMNLLWNQVKNLSWRKGFFLIELWMSRTFLFYGWFCFFLYFHQLLRFTYFGDNGKLLLKLEKFHRSSIWTVL